MEEKSVKIQVLVPSRSLEMLSSLPDKINFITIMSLHGFPIHDDDIKHSSVPVAVHNSSMNQHRKKRPVRSAHMKMNIIIGMTAFDLFPDTVLCCLLLVLTDQVAKTSLRILKHLIHRLTTRQTNQLTVDKKDFIIYLVRLIDYKRARQILRDILECKAKLLANFQP